MKYVCDACGWEYDEALGDPDHGIAPAPNSRTFPKILNALSAAWAKTCSLKHNTP